MSAKQRLSRRSISVLRNLRTLAYLTLAPLDYVSRSINGKADFPPLHLRRHVGPLRTFEASGAEFMTYLRLLLDLQPNERVLDIGCGCGLMALQLKDYLDSNGAYAGVDIHGPSISWCTNHITTAHPNFRFARISDGELPYEAHSFDLILLKSIFTHLRPAEVENYLSEIERLLKPDGRCLASFFLLNHEQKALAAKGANALQFNFGDDRWRYVYEHSPESASAFDENYILDLITKHNLELREPIRYGTWTGRKNGLSFQDLLQIQPRNRA
ncbi:MAG TPA: class I SAM-dependent methyltransferase [Pyrinomonadaceae bacterium]|nr:class I SAM-dependent methyltransferase [Pyrinomonadaceae bacterium]